MTEQQSGVTMQAAPDEPRPMTLIDALAVLAWTRTQGRRLTPEQNEAARKAQAVVDAHAEPWVR